MIGLADVNYFEPWWVQIGKSLVIFAVVFAILPILIVYERKLLGRFQGRYGPNRVGPFGLMQPLAEIVKFAMKEPFRTTTSVGFLFRLAPVISIITAVGALAIIPWGDVQYVLGQHVGLYGIDVSIGPLYVFALAGISFYGIMLGGWLLPFGINPPGWVDPFVVLAKILIVFTFFVWIRATLPRLRYDQLMSFGWKILLPLATLNLLVTAIVVVS